MRLSLLAVLVLVSCAQKRPSPTEELRASFPGLAEQILAGATRGPISLALQGDGHFVLSDEDFSVRVREDAPGATAFWTSTAQGQEEWLLTDVPADGVAARWTIEGGTLKEEAGHFTVEDERGEGRLEVTAPRSYVSPERLVATRLVARGQVLEVHVDAAGQRALIDPAWRRAPSTLVSRRKLALVLLADGKVLAAGGVLQTFVYPDATETPLNTAETYDPITAKWTPAANPMRFTRENFSGVLLRNGKALLSGGTGVLYSELYDPAVNGFDAGTLAIQTAHTDHLMTLLPNGNALVLGGTVEQYNPANNTWTPLSMQPVSPHNAGNFQLIGPLDGDYQVLLAVGLSGSTYLSTAQVYDPLNGTWATEAMVPQAGNAYRSLAGGAGRFADGTLILHGGGNNAPVTSNTLGTGWVERPALQPNTRGTFSSAGMLANGSFVSCSGQETNYTNPGCGIITSPTATTFSLIDTSTNYSDWFFQTNAVLMPNGKTLIIGGIFNGIDKPGTTRVGIIDITAPFVIDGGTLPQGVTNQTATLLNTGAVLLAGGAASGATPTTNVQLYLDGGALPGLPMGTPRIGHTATLLHDGRVLVVGGNTGAAATATVELYDPTSGTWSPGPSLTAARAFHTATALPDGTVVVAGGLGATGGAIKSAERYGPVDGGWGWSPAGTFQGNQRSNHVATLLSDGRVLVASGKSGTSALNSTELYDPQANTWSNPGQPLPFPVYDATATLLGSGAVLIAGGVTTPSGLETTSAAVWEAATGWTALPALPRARARHAAVVLANNQVMLAGGGLAATGAVRALDIFDLETGQWTSPALTVTGHEGGTATLLPSGQVLIAGGSTPIGPNEVNVERFDEGRNPVPGSVPVLDPLSVTSAPPGTTVALTGTGFAGLHIGMGGSRGSPASNFPLITMERQGNEQRFFAPISNWTGTTTDARIPPQAPSGWYWLRANVNGITGPGRPLFVGVPVDAGTVDAGVDAGMVMVPDAGSIDAGTVDAGTVDAGTVDAGTVDAGTVDAGQLDASVEVDAGSMADAGTPPDAGTTNPADAGDGTDGGTTPAPGLYGCLCGASGASGSSLVWPGVLMLLFAVRRRSPAGMVMVAALTMLPLTSRAEPVKPKSGKVTKAAGKQVPAPAPEIAPKVEAPPVEAPPPAATVAPTPTPTKAATPRDPHRRIKVAVLPLECGPGVQKELAGVITDAIASALATHKDLEVTSSRDVAARLSFERQREMLGASGCADNMQCMVEIGNALGVDKITFGSVARLGGSAVLSTTVIELEGSEVVRHTERVKNVSEEAFLDAIPPTVAALFPAPAPEVAAGGPQGDLSASPGSTELDGTHFGLTVRGQLSPLNLSPRPLGAFVVHVDWSFSEAFSLGLGAVIASPVGVMARGTWVPFNASGRVRPLVSLEVPVFFAAAGPMVGVGGAVGVEFRVIRNLAIGAEVPLSYYFGGPADLQRFWLFGALTVTGRL